TKLGYIKRMNEENFKAQHRGGKGIKGMETIEDDYIVDMLMMSSHDYLMFFTDKGRVYRIKAYEIPESSRTSRGVAVVNILQLQPEEKITAMIPVENYDENQYLFMATAKGFVKKTKITEFANIRKNGLTAINLRDDDTLIEVKMTLDDEDILMFTKFGQAIRFAESEVRPTGRATMGVIGMNLADEDVVIGMQMASQGSAIMIVSENGMGKCTLVSEFSAIHRGGKGVKCYKITEKTGNIIGAKAVDMDDEVMLINTIGTIIRINVADTTLLSRITSGVKLINLKDSEKLISIAKVKKSDTILDSDSAENQAEETASSEETKIQEENKEE
ncbi:MAG: DNA gyrase subunit A, partial [Pseudobutyrivibrio sp.]|nr:DNA gyrase subunit A [Pseudobutyrivibrio sp.]